MQASNFFLRTTDDNSLSTEPMTIEEMEKVLIEKALEKYDKNISAIATELGITRPTLYSKMKKYGLS